MVRTQTKNAVQSQLKNSHKSWYQEHVVKLASIGSRWTVQEIRACLKVFMIRQDNDKTFVIATVRKSVYFKNTSSHYINALLLKYSYKFARNTVF